MTRKSILKSKPTKDRTMKTVLIFTCIICGTKKNLACTVGQKEDYEKDPDNYKNIFAFHTKEHHWFKYNMCKECLNEGE